MFARQPKASIARAIALVDQAAAIADSYRRDNAYVPDSADIRQFDALLETLWANHCMVERVRRSLLHRLQA